MRHFFRFAYVPRLARSMLVTIRTLATIAAGSMLLLGASSSAQATAELFISQCGGCHNNVKHPLNLVYNAAGNAAIIETVNALGMGASGSGADHFSVAEYLDSIKPTITLAPIEHDSSGTVIFLTDIIVSNAQINAFLKIIESIQTVTPPTKGTVQYHWGIGKGATSTVTYTPFAGQSGTDTWTYQGIGSKGNTTVRTASVSIASGTNASFTPVAGVWWNPSEPGSGLGLDYKDGTLIAEIYSYLAGGPSQWYLAAGAVINNVFTATLDKYTGGQCVTCAYNAPAISGNDGQITITFTSPTTGIADLPGGRHIAIQRYFQSAQVAGGFIPVGGVWWNPSEPGSGLGLDYENGTLIVEVYSYLPGGASQWYLAAGPLTNNVFTATLDKYTGGQCVSCAYKASAISGNDGLITITFTSPTTGTADLPGGRRIQIERYFQP
jgi:hypothetical protein